MKNAKVIVVVAALAFIVGVVAWRMAPQARETAQAGQEGVPTDQFSISGVILNRSGMPEAGTVTDTTAAALPAVTEKAVHEDSGKRVVGVSLMSSRALDASSARTWSPSMSASPQRALLDRYCVGCHNEKLRTAGLLLDQMDLSKIGEGAPIWENVVQKLRIGSMPPMGWARPEKATTEAFVAWLEDRLDRAAAAKPDVGRPLLHRLNRTEYANAIRDLLALDIDVASLLPPDNASHGFDNVADGLSVSPLLIDQYLSAARKISRLAVGGRTILPATEIYRNEPDLTQDDHLEGLPLGTRGGLRVRHTFPLDGEYAFRLRLVRNLVSVIRGLCEPHELDVWIDDVVVQQFTMGGPQVCEALESGSKAKGEGYQAPTAAYRADEPLHFRVPVTAGPHTITATFVMKTHALSEVVRGATGGARVRLRQPPLRSFMDGPVSVTGVAHVDTISVSGPYGATRGSDTPARRRIFVCQPKKPAEEASCAKRIISTLAHRAYRGPVSDATLRALLTFYETGRGPRGGGTFEAGIEMALRRILASPRFVFRFERDPEHVPAGKVHPITDLELASRLSFFLWSSLPDDELLRVAEQGRLKDPAVLEQQARRMMADPRARSLVSNFAGQWLYLRNLRSTYPSQELFPDFDANLRQAFLRETELFFESIIRENRSVIDFLDANYTFVNERLALHYGIPHVRGSHFRRVTLPDDRRGGLLGQGSILTVTSYDSRTAPTIRGKWLLENILGVPPPQPPPNVPTLKNENEEAVGKVLTMRERMEQHRKNPVCASCHAGMDPLGFALENFDAVGRWRDTTDGTTRIDASGNLPDGTKFEGPAELRRALLGYQELFVKTLTTKLLTYALGRGVEYYDMPAVRQILRDSAADRYRWSSLVLGVIKSAPFQMRTSAARAPTTVPASVRR